MGGSCSKNDHQANNFWPEKEIRNLIKQECNKTSREPSESASIDLAISREEIINIIKQECNRASREASELTAADLALSREEIINFIAQECNRTSRVANEPTVADVKTIFDDIYTRGKEVSPVKKKGET